LFLSSKGIIEGRFSLRENQLQNLGSSRVADKSFYDKFCDEFYKRYKSYEELPEVWRNSKKAVADLILGQTFPDGKILSIGCGSGYVEYLLRKEYYRY